MEEGDTRRITTRLVLRKIFKTISILMDSKPQIYITPDNFNEKDPILAGKLADVGGKQGLAELFQKLFDDWWSKNYIDKTNYRIFQAAIRDSCSLISTFWDDIKDDVMLKGLDPLGFIPEPGVLELSDMCYWFYERRIDARRAAKEYGTDIVEENIGNTSQESNNKNNNARERGEVGEQDIVIIDSLWQDDSATYSYADTGEVATEKQYNKWIKKEEESGTATSLLAGERKIKREKLFPNGRLISFTDKGIYRDEKNPRPFSPLEFFVPLPDSYDIWGHSMAEILSPFQEAYDKILQMVMENFERIGNAVIFVNQSVYDSLGKKGIADIPAQVVPIDDQHSVRDVIYHVAGNVIAQDAWKIMELLDAHADDASNVNDAAGGSQPVGAQSGRAYLALQEATNRILRIISRFYENVLENIAKKVIYYMYNYYDAERSYGWIEGDQQKNGRIPLNLREIEMTIDVKVQPGSSIPQDPQKKADLAMALYQLVPPAITQEELLKAVEFQRDPNAPPPMPQGVPGMPPGAPGQPPMAGQPPAMNVPPGGQPPQPQPPGGLILPPAAMSDLMRSQNQVQSAMSPAPAMGS
jgi:hypothetical protein